MQKRFLIGLALSATLFVGCGEKPKEEQTVSEPAPVAVPVTTPVETKQEVAVVNEAKTFDATSVYSSKCASCHGAKGEGKSIFPKLAGQSKEALVKKLNGYKEGTFGNDKKAMMIPNVQNLSSDEIAKIAEVVSQF
jgi:cytochrome c553